MIVADSSVLVPAIVSDHEVHGVAFDAAQQVDASVGHALIQRTLSLPACRRRTPWAPHRPA